MGPTVTFAGFCLILTGIFLLSPISLISGAIAFILPAVVGNGISEGGPGNFMR